ncbi:AmmeMemoRadiSam system protein A [Butyrivibrio sp. VCB2001]|uniref:AmmeMemoRadiSam system protein A n=1 Tax=Butyrivibrio sp. VCB2001 TaxID=1280667 RepID=UPI00040D16A8|nr:AmmeMemoRadiSam system protein A [Butyrivibrio sp. VCB2001]
MPIVGAFMVPHPPIMLPEVGRGEEEKIRATTDAYRQVAEKIAELAPETIIISSPHSVMYADYFHVSPGKRATGDMGQFRAGQVKFDVEYDTDLVAEICAISDSYGQEKDDIKSMEIQGFPAGTMGERDPDLDHGTMIPLYYIREKYKDFKIVRIGLSGLSLPMHYEMGQIIAEAVARTGVRAVYVASGDLSHKMKEDGPYGFAKEGPEYDERIMEVCGSGEFDRLLDFDETFCDKAAECGHRSFVMMAGALDGLSVTAHKLSHEATFGVGYGICTFEVGGPDDSRHFLEMWRDKKKAQLEKRKQDEDPYVRLARYSLESYITMGKRITKKDVKGDKWSDMDREMFERRAGTFVSIHKDGALRGCIGTILPTTSCIADEIMQNAISAGTNDPRFPMIKEDELPYLEMSVDVLDEPEPIDSPDQLDVKRYGVIVTHGRKRGLLLPNLDGVDSIEQQIDIARQKAGIYEDEDYSLERFEVIRHY